VSAAVSVRCPDGHPSETEDWCDECGIRIAADDAAPARPPAAAAAAAAAAAPPAPAGAGGADAPAPAAAGGDAPAAIDAGASGGPAGIGCPECSTDRVGDDRYCEVCGYDFVTATGPAPAVAVPLRSGAGLRPPPSPPPTAPPPTGQKPPAQKPPGPVSSPAPPPVGDPSGWSAEVVADRAFYDRGSEEDVEFPTTVVTRVVELGGTRSLIGRQSRSRGFFPDIDLSAVPEDRGVSRTHAMLDHPADGSLTITDLGSTNGTWLDDDERPLARGVAVELHDGTRIYVGSWTRITVRRRTTE
jgi:hypothetical protein